MKQTTPALFLKGKTVYLRGLEERDVDGPYAAWLNDSEVCRFNSHARFPITKQELRRYVRSAKSSSALQVFAIVTKEGHTHIGNISLQHINSVDRSAELAIIIGDKQHWGKGIGYDVWTLLVRYGFDVLNLHRLSCGCSEKNRAMIRIAEKSGMKREGRRRDAMYKNGRYVDVLEFGILKAEFQS